MTEFKKEQFFAAIKQIAEQNLLTEAEILAIIEESVKKSFHSKFDPDAELELIIDKDREVFELINHSKYVVDEPVADEYKALEISVEDAQKINPEAKEGDTVSEVVDFNAYSSALAQQIRQLITQNVREKRKAAIYAKHKGLKGEMITATVMSQGRSHAVLQMEDGTIAFMPPKLKNPNIKLGNGEKVKVYVEDVLEESKDAQIIVSNGSKEVVKRLLEVEVPEIMDGTVEIVALSRMPGDRTKVAVKSNNENVDAVGAIIGAGGQRIQSIIEKLEGEKLDVIAWSEDVNAYVANSLSPAKVIAVIDKKDAEGNVVEGHKIAITPNRHQTLAIGKRGSNARLAVELVNNRIDVLSIDEAKEKGIEFEWNGNVTPEVVELIESGNRIRREGGNGRPQRSNGHSFENSINTSEMDSDIESFNEGLQFEEEATASMPIQDEQSYDLETDFSEEDLEKMQADFEFDTEIADLDLDGEDFGTEE